MWMSSQNKRNWPRFTWYVEENAHSEGLSKSENYWSISVYACFPHSRKVIIECAIIHRFGVVLKLCLEIVQLLIRLEQKVA
jgi:hypothetical protein